VATVLVTGGAGFIGSHLTRALLSRGDQVTVLDDFSTGTRENLVGAEVRVIEGDIRDPQAVATAMRGVDIVFHHAALISVVESMQNPPACYETNLMGSVHVLMAAHQAKARRVVMASSAAVYGESGGTVSETDPVTPISPYAASKMAMEQAGLLFSRAYGLPTVSLRYFNVYGPRQRADSPYAAVIPIFIEQMLAGDPVTIHGDGQQRRDFVYVEDVVRANLLASELPPEQSGVFNVAGGRSVTVDQLAKTLRGLIPGVPEPVRGPSRLGDIRFSAADLRLSAQALGYRPVTALERGLQQTVEWFRAGRPIAAA
jgi:nucleoside-diphosphate-sugar epimerase